jgi:hypothetical protein
VLLGEGLLGIREDRRGLGVSAAPEYWKCIIRVLKAA